MHVFFDFITHFGGAQRSTTLLCRHLQRELPLTVLDPYGVCQPYHAALREFGIPHRVLLPEARHVVIGHEGRPLRRAASLLRQVPDLLRLRSRTAAALRELDPELVWTNSGKSLVFLASIPALRRYPLALFARGWFQRHQVAPLSRWVIRRRVAGVLAVSSATGQALASWGVDPARVHVVYNMFDFDTVRALSAAGLHAPVPHGDRRCRVLMPAGLLRTKGQHTAIAAAARLKAAGRDFVMWLAGDTGIGDVTGYPERLRTQIAAAGLEDHVFMLGWRPDVYALMAAATAVILPTHTEGFPRAVTEALLLEKPVVATPVGGVVDVVRDGETGLLVPVEDDAALADRLLALDDRPEWAAQLARQGAAFVEGEFAPAAHLRRVRDAFAACRAAWCGPPAPPPASGGGTS